MITFIIAFVSVFLSLLGIYLIVKGYLRDLLRHSLMVKLLFMINLVIFIISFDFILASVASSVEGAQFYTKLAVISLRFGIVVLFIFSEIVRNAKHLLSKVVIASIIFGSTITTYVQTESSFTLVYGFWERTGFVHYGLLNVVDLALTLFLVLMLIVSLFLTAVSVSRRISNSDKRKVVLRYYYGIELILLASFSVFILNKIINFGVFINNALILVSLSIIALILVYSIHANPYFLYIGGARLQGIIIVDSGSGLLVFEKSLTSKAMLVSGAFWAIITILKKEFDKKPRLIVMSDTYVVLSYAGPIIGIFLFDNYMDILPLFSDHVCNVLVESLKARGLLGGIVVEDKELRQEITKTINDVLDPFIA